MKMIKWIRIDDRLIHGMVASTWLSHTQVEQVIVVSDRVAKDEIQKNVLKMAAPGVKVHIFSTDRFVEIFHKQPIKKPTMLILPDTTTALTLVEKEIPIDYINFGGMRKKGMPHSYHYDLNFNEEEYQAIYKLKEKGVKVEYQLAAYDDPVSLIEMIEKCEREGQA